MMLSPVPAQRALKRRVNTLRITPALSAMAATMNGLDPDPGHVAALADTPITAETLHQAAAVALRQVMGPMLLSRTSSAADHRRGEAAVDAELPTLRDAYYLAMALAERREEQTPLDPEEIEPALLVGSMQVRFLEAVCSQIEVTIVAPELLVGARIPARAVLKNGGNLAPGVRLLADYSAGSDGSAGWLHAVSTITVAGEVGRAVVDAGPENASAQWAARLAAPVTVTATGGFWPVTVVEDCLRICAGAVRRWVAAMPRELCGEDGSDIMLRSGPALRDFLVSPATSALTGHSGKHPVLPLRAVTASGVGSPPRGTLATMRTGGVPGSELSPDPTLPVHYRMHDIHRDEVTLLSSVEVGELPAEVEVTVNLPIPEWKDVSTLLDEVRESGGITLTSPVLGWTARDVVAGQRHRVSLRARVHRGVVCESGGGVTVLLPAGSTFTVLGSDSGKGHTTLYAIQERAVTAGGE